MDMAWFRDLSITIMGFVITVVFIIVAIVVYKLYGAATSTMKSVRAASKDVSDTVSIVREAIKPFVMIMTMIQAIRQGFEQVTRKNKKQEEDE
jgi:Mg2+/Co2+ transporter CorB